MKLEGKDSTGRLILLVLVLLLTGVLALILPDIVREWVAVLIWYSLWIGRLALNAIPQPLLWILLLVIALPITVGSLAKRGKPAQGEDKA